VRISIVSFLPLLTLVWAVTLSAAETWPQFRGPGAEGKAATSVPLTWSATENIVWKTAIPGKGWSSPVIAGDRIWLTTAIESPISPEEAKRRISMANGYQGELTAAGPVSLRLVSIDRRTGRHVYDVELFHVEAPAALHKINSYASPTPVVEGDRIYCHFGTYGTAAVDAESGRAVWARRFEVDHIVGPGSSPVLHGNLLILTCDGGDKQYIVAVDKTTGKTVWQTNRPPIDAKDGDMRKSFSTPLIVNDGTREQMIVPGAQWLVSYDPRTGKEHWRLNHGRGFSVVPRPVYHQGIVYFCTGFGKAKLFAVRTDGQGDVTGTHVAWQSDRQIALRPSPILQDGLLYIISDTGVATCFDAATGKIHWTKRIPGNYSASPLLADGRIYFFSDDGKTTVIKTGEKFEELAVNTLEDGCMASAAALEGALYVRTRGFLYRIQQPNTATAMTK